MDLNTTLLSIGGSAGALAAVGVVVRGAWRVNRRIVRIADAVQELSPNSGHSIKDTVTRIDEGQCQLQEGLTDLRVRFDRHLEDHAKRR